MSKPDHLTVTQDVSVFDNADFKGDIKSSKTEQMGLSPVSLYVYIYI
jgi:hypothetical protein